MSLRSFREAVAAELGADLGINILPGRLEEPSTRRDVGSCWTVGVTENPRNVQEELLTLGLRIFKRAPLSRDRTPDELYDPGELEDLVEAIQLALRDRQTTLAQEHGIWFFRLTAAELDPQLRKVEAELAGIRSNLFAQG